MTGNDFSEKQFSGGDPVCRLNLAEPIPVCRLPAVTFNFAYAVYIYIHVISTVLYIRVISFLGHSYFFNISVGSNKIFILSNISILKQHDLCLCVCLL